MVFLLLYKAALTPVEVGEQSLALVIYLLDMTISLSLEESITRGNVSGSLTWHISYANFSN